jgi:hypothetical protein
VDMRTEVVHNSANPDFLTRLALPPATSKGDTPDYARALRFEVHQGERLYEDYYPAKAKAKAPRMQTTGRSLTIQRMGSKLAGLAKLVSSRALKPQLPVLGPQTRVGILEVHHRPASTLATTPSQHRPCASPRNRLLSPHPTRSFSGFLDRALPHAQSICGTSNLPQEQGTLLFSPLHSRAFFFCISTAFSFALCCGGVAQGRPAGGVRLHHAHRLGKQRRHRHGG